MRKSSYSNSKNFKKINKRLLNKFTMKNLNYIWKYKVEDDW